MKAWSTDFYAKINTEAPHCVSLLTAFSPDQVITLLDTTPPRKGYASGKMALLDALRPKENDCAALHTCLELAAKAGWDGPKLLQVIGALANHQSAPQLRAAIHADLAFAFDRDTQFLPWVKAVGVLVEDGCCTINCGGQVPLPGGPTIEVGCTVSVLPQTFVIHTHPGAQGASVGAVYASKVHIKHIAAIR